MTGHLHPKKSKAITVTFKAEEPVLMKEEAVIVALTQITLNDPQVITAAFKSFLFAGFRWRMSRLSLSSPKRMMFFILRFFFSSYVVVSSQGNEKNERFFFTFGNVKWGWEFRLKHVRMNVPV